MEFQKYITENFSEKALVNSSALYSETLSANIIETAFATSNLLQNIGQVTVNTPSYKNVYVTHPSISDVTENGVIPDSTVQTYSVHASSFDKVATNIELSREVMMFSKFDIAANTASLVGTVLSDKIAQLVVADIDRRIALMDTDPEYIRFVNSGINGSWGDIGSVYQLFAQVLKLIPDAYDSTTKIFMNKNNLTDFMALVTDAMEQVWLVQGGKLLGRYDIVVADQLDNDTILVGDLESAMDVVSLLGQQTVNPYSKPDAVRITDTSSYSVTAKDLNGLAVLKARA